MLETGFSHGGGDDILTRLSTPVPKIAVSVENTPVPETCPNAAHSHADIQYVRTAGGSVRIFVDTLWREPEGGGPEEHHGPGWSQRLSRGA